MGLIGGQAWVWPLERLCLRTWKKPGEGGVTRQEARGPAATLGAGSPPGCPAAPEQSPGPLHGLHHPGPQRLLSRSASYISPPTWLFSAARLHQAQSGLRSTGYSSSAQSRALPSELARLVSSARNSSGTSPPRTSDFSVEAAPSPHTAAFILCPSPLRQDECSYTALRTGVPPEPRAKACCRCLMDVFSVDGWGIEQCQCELGPDGWVKILEGEKKVFFFFRRWRFW